MREVLKKYLDNDEALDAYIDSKTTYLSVDDVEIILNQLAQQNTHPLNLIEQLRKERDELKCYVNTVKKPSVERYEELEEQLKAEKQKNEELIKLLKDASEYLMNYSNGIEPVFAVNQTREEIEQLLTKEDYETDNNERPRFGATKGKTIIKRI